MDSFQRTQSSYRLSVAAVDSINYYMTLFIFLGVVAQKNSDPGRVRSLYTNKANYPLSVYTLLIELAFLKTVLLNSNFWGFFWTYGRHFATHMLCSMLTLYL